MKKWCKNCKYCRPVPHHENYNGTVGWCMCPKPFWYKSYPLIATEYAKKAKCDTYDYGSYEESL